MADENLTDDSLTPREDSTELDAAIAELDPEEQALVAQIAALRS